MSTVNATGRHPGRLTLTGPPIPKEHGAWVILYAPMVLGFAAANRLAPLEWLLTTITVTSLFLGREAASLILRGRKKHGTWLWAVIFSIAALASGFYMLAIFSKVPLLVVGFTALLLFSIHSLLLKYSGRKRLDRTEWGEILGVAALTLTAPAAYVSATGYLDLRAVITWLACVAYYSSSIFYVKMWLAAAKLKKSWCETSRKKAGVQNNVYNVMLVIAVGISASQLEPAKSAIAVLSAFAPAIIRSARGYHILSPQLPPLRKIGLQETLYAVWFTALMAVALRLT